MMRLRALLSCVLIFLPASLRADPEFSIGDPPPPLDLEHVVSAPESVEADALCWENLAGRVVVLEFWATWCAPCRAAIPHMNDLADAFADKPLLFISVTDESPETAKAFLEHREMAGIVACDTDRSLHQALGVRGIPTTIIVGPDGRIAGRTHPDSLNEDILERILAGERIEDHRTSRNTVPADEVEAAIQLALQTPPGQAVPGRDPAVVKGTPDALAQVIIRPVEEPSHFTAKSTASATSSGASAEVILAEAYDVPSKRVIVEADLPETLFTLVVKAATAEAKRTLLQAAAQIAFGVQCEVVQRPVEVYFLRAPDGVPAALQESTYPGSSFKATGDGLSFESFDMDMFVKSVGERTGRPLLNGTGLDGRWSFDIVCDTQDPAAVRRALQDLGFTLEPAIRDMEHLLVRPANPARAEAP